MAGTRTLILERFGGVDFFSDESQVPLHRSPDARNMICDSRFFPVKRTGYRLVAQLGKQTVHGLFDYTDPGGVQWLIIHAGALLYRWKPDMQAPGQIYAEMARMDSAAFHMGGKLYLLDGRQYLCFDGNTVAPVKERAYVPTTVMVRPPAGGGKSLESPNLLAPRRCNSFTADGTSRVYQLDAKGLDDSPVECIVHGTALTEGGGFTVDRTAGTVSFTDIPAADSGVDGVEIRFGKAAERAGAIDGCCLCSMYGGKNDTRVFVSGNKDYPSLDWHCAVTDPTYFPESGYARVGADSVPILGYLRQYDTQMILKRTSEQDASIFLRTSEWDQEGRQIFPVRQGASGVGAVAPKSLALLEDVPLFLSPQGVYAVTGTQVWQEKAIQHRSALIDKRLLREERLDGAVSVCSRGRYYLCLGSHCYVADSRQAYAGGEGQTQWEWYYWDNIPARCLLEFGGQVYFGTEDGGVYRFSEPWEKDAYLDAGEAIDAYWKTPMLTFSDAARLKNIRSVAATVLPYARSAVTMYYSDPSRWMDEVLNETVDLFDFGNLDFSRLSFLTIPAPKTFVSWHKRRHVTVFQVSVRNDRPGEPFGLLSLGISYSMGREVV